MLPLHLSISLLVNSPSLVFLALSLAVWQDNEDMTIAGSGILETLHVQAINVSLHGASSAAAGLCCFVLDMPCVRASSSRGFVYSADGRCAGIYLMDDGTAEMFTLHDSDKP